MRAHIAGGGFGGLAAAALLIRNAGVLGADITIYEADERLGGVLSRRQRYPICWTQKQASP